MDIPVNFKKSRILLSVHSPEGFVSRLGTALQATFAKEMSAKCAQNAKAVKTGSCLIALSLCQNTFRYQYLPEMSEFRS